MAGFERCEAGVRASLTGVDLGSGVAQGELELPRTLFYDTLSQQSGFPVGDDGDLMAIVGGSFGPDGGASYVEIANVLNIRRRNEEIVAAQKS